MSLMIYLAAPWVDKENMETFAKQFNAEGHHITHRWWNVEEAFEGTGKEKVLERYANEDYEGVATADALILFNTAKSEGKAVEQGIALAKGIPIIAIGKLGEMSKNVFHYLPDYIWVDSIEDALVELRRMD
jgi:nucleoside 2-deoxyribosyltransferase